MVVASYDPRWLNVFKDAASKEVLLKMGDIKTAVNLRQKLYRLRKAMGEENHPFFSLAIRVDIGAYFEIVATGKKILFVNYKQTPIPNEEYTVFLSCRPQDRKYDDILSSHGYHPDDPPPLD